MIRLVDYIRNLTGDQVIIVLLNFTVLGNPGERIGNPIHKHTLEDVDTQKAQQQQPYIKPERGITNNSSTGNNSRPNNPYASNPYQQQQQQQHPPQGAGAISHNPYASQSNNNYNTNASHSIQRTQGDTVYTPIAALNQYVSKFIVCARITYKSEVRTWHNDKGEGSLFSIEVLDSSGTDLKITLFREAVEKFFSLLEEEKVYTFTGGRLKTANRMYNKTKSNYEMTMDGNSEIHLVPDSGSIAPQQFDFVPIAEIDNKEPNSNIDVLAIVKSVSEAATFTSKRSNKEVTKADLALVDPSGASINCTVWGEKAHKAQSELAGMPLVAFRRARVGDFGGRTLSANTMIINPKIPEADEIHAWWESTGKTGGEVKSLSMRGGGSKRFPEFDDRKTIAAIRGERMGLTEKGDFISFKATFSFIKSDKEGGAWYTACPMEDEPCRKRVKVTQNADGMYHCDRCDRDVAEPFRRFIFSALVSDDTSKTWVNIFDDQAKDLFGGVTADDLYNTMKNGDQEEYDACFARASQTEWIMTCRVKEEEYEGEKKLKTILQSLHPVDYAKEGRNLLNEILRTQ